MRALGHPGGVLTGLALWAGVGLALVLALIAGPSARAQTAPVILGSSTATLYGPWRFHVGDDPRWKESGFNDAAWETVDLTPKPGAHDPDVGIRGYVPGWNARGHKGYAGYAWYRLRLSVQPSGSAPLDRRAALYRRSLSALPERPPARRQRQV